MLTTNADPCTPLTAVFITAQTIVWTRAPLSGFDCPARGASTVIRLDRLTGTVTSRIVPVPSWNIAHSNGEYVIWVSWSANNGTVHLLNRRTGQMRTMSRPGSSAAQINEDMALWQIDNDSGLEALELKTFRYVRLEHNTTNGTLNTVASDPHLGSGRRVIWEKTDFPSTSATFKYWLVVADVP